MSTNEYMKKYIKQRYHSEPKFRQKMIDNSVRWQRKNKEHVNEQQRIRYAKRTPKEKE